MVPPQPDTPEFELNLRTIMRILLKWRWLFVAFVVAGLGAATAMTLLATPLFRATATIEIKRQESQIMKESSIEPVVVNDPAAMATQFGLMQSRDLAVRVAQRLNLASNPAYAPQSLSREARENVAVGRLRAGLSVAPVGTSRLMSVNFVSADRNEAARISNAFADSFISTGLERRYDATAYARNFLQQRITAVKAALDQSERQLVAYARQQGIVNIESAPGPDGRQGTGTSLDASSLTALNGSLSVAQDARMQAEGRYNEARRNGTTTETIQNPTITALQGERTRLSGEYQEKLGIYKPDFPQMKDMQARIAVLDRQIARERAGVSSALRSEYEAALSRENALRNRVNQLKGSVLDLRDRSIQYNILQREVDTNRSLYDALLQRYKQIGVAGGIGESQASIVDHAIAPTAPFSPRLAANLIMGLLIGTLLGIAVILAIEYIDDTIKVPEDVETKLKVSVLGVIPKLTRDTTLIEELSISRSKISEAYFTARTSLQFSSPEGTPRVLLVTSTKPSEGKSSSALGLAQSFAKVGLKVLLIDADMRKPSFTAKEGDGTGLSALLAGGNLSEPKILSTNITNLHLLPSGPIPPNPAELLASQNLPRLLAIMRERFDLIVVDGPPILGLADAPLLGAACDGTVVIIESGAIRRPAALNSIKQLRASGARVMGVVLTKFNPKFEGYGYGYGYSYGYSYGYGADKGENEKDRQRRIELMS
jgi:capsular exopolysaccharide synthesis family protein